MADEYNFSELRNYLQGQIDIGDAELLLEEPWAPPVRRAAAPGPAVPRPSVPQTAPQQPSISRNPPPSFVNRPAAAPAQSSMGASAPDANNQVFDDLFGVPAAAPAAVPLGAAPNMPAPRTVQRAVYAFESASSLDDFYGMLKSEALYAKEPALARYVGAERPKLLFLLPAVKMGQNPAEFFQGPVGEMLIRLFANLGYAPEQMGVTYFFKSTERGLSPLLETALKKMLTKELSFINPEIMVSCGQNLFHQLFGKAKNFEELAGSDQEFAGIKTCPLVDPYAMVNDKQMKWLTWKVHIPRSTLFAIKQ